MTPLQDAALAYAAAGYAVFPLRGKLPHRNCPACEPRSAHYQPHQPAECDHELCHGLYAATSNLDLVSGWWARWPQANIGARIPRGLFVLDVDPRHGGGARLAELETTHGHLPPTRTSLSGRGDGGCHYWFVHPGGTLTAARLGEGLDVKTTSGYVVLPPSRHPDSGRPYRWADPILDPAPVPAWLAHLLLPPPPAPVTPAGDRPRRWRRGRVGERAIERFTATTSWADVLGPHGWTCPDPDPDGDGARWRHPGATNAKSATVRHGLLFVYSQTTPFQATEAGAPRGYTKFRAWAVLNHGGDQAAAARALRGGR